MALYIDSFYTEYLMLEVVYDESYIKFFMLIVIVLSVIMLSVTTPNKPRVSPIHPRALGKVALVLDDREKSHKGSDTLG
jgi:hypothetical protein